jgi:hypothetical protein
MYQFPKVGFSPWPNNALGGTESILHAADMPYLIGNRTPAEWQNNNEEFTPIGGDFVSALGKGPKGSPQIPGSWSNGMELRASLTPASRL